MTQEEYRDDLIMKVSRAKEIIASLDGCKGFSMMIEDIDGQVARLDANWHLIPEDEKWASRIRELRTSKLASCYIKNIVETYKNDILKMTEEIDKLDNIETSVIKDFDTE